MKTEKPNKMAVELRMVPVEKINPAKYNPRKELQPSDPEYESIKQSIKAHGLADPLIWNAHNGVLIGGHQRLRILVNEFKVKEVPCSVRYITDEKEEMSLNAALNKNQGEWDFEKLKLMLFKFSDDDANDPLRAAMGFAPLEFKGILEWSPLVTSPANLEQTPEERMGGFRGGRDQADRSLLRRQRLRGHRAAVGSGARKRKHRR